MRVLDMDMFPTLNLDYIKTSVGATLKSYLLYLVKDVEKAVNANPKFITRHTKIPEIG